MRKFLELARQKHPRILPAPQAWPCQFHWPAHVLEPVLCRPRAIPIAVSFPGSFSCVLPADRFAILFRLIHGIDFRSEMGIDSIAAEFTVCREQPAFRRESMAEHLKSSDPPVVRKLAVHLFEGRLNPRRLHCSCNQRAEIPAAISDNHHLLS